MAERVLTRAGVLLINVSVLSLAVAGAGAGVEAQQQPAAPPATAPAPPRHPPRQGGHESGSVKRQRSASRSRPDTCRTTTRPGAGVAANPLVLANRPVRDANTWRNQRRQEILRLYETDIYGRVPPAPKVS